jgi:hypothetical protein
LGTVFGREKRIGFNVNAKLIFNVKKLLAQWYMKQKQLFLSSLNAYYVRKQVSLEKRDSKDHGSHQRLEAATR